MSDLIVTRDYTAHYADPIRLDAGEVFTLNGKVDAWEDHADWVWLWGVAADGREGWVPADYVDQRDPAVGVATCAYDARELAVKAGDPVVSLANIAGWHLCRAVDGRIGWVPGSHLGDGGPQTADE